MKKIVLILVLVFTSFSFSQEIKKEKVEALEKVTFYTEDGVRYQEGTFKDGKLHGKWVAYNHNQEITTIAYYKDGKKDGLWFFKGNEGNVMTEVLYDENKVLFANSYSNLERVVATNY